jgi:hypothetical protein
MKKIRTFFLFSNLNGENLKNNALEYLDYKKCSSLLFLIYIKDS